MTNTRMMYFLLKFFCLENSYLSYLDMTYTSSYMTYHMTLLSYLIPLGGQGVIIPPLQFLDQRRSNSFSFKHKGHLWVFRNYNDQKFNDFSHVCYNF